MSREGFYSKKVLECIKSKNSKILILGAGSLDRKIFEELGYKNVTYSNIQNSKETNLNIYENSGLLAYG